MSRKIIAGTLHGTVGSDFWSRTAHYNDGAEELVCRGEVKKQNGRYIVSVALSPGTPKEIGRPGNPGTAEALLRSEVGHLARLAADSGRCEIEFRYD